MNRGKTPANVRRGTSAGAVALALVGIAVCLVTDDTSVAVAAPSRIVDVDTWAWCGVHPDDLAARSSAASMATAAGIDVTFGPCNVPTPDYTPANTRNRYVSPALYMRLVEINAAVGIKTAVYDARLWSPNAQVRDTAIAFWTPVLRHVAVWDMGDEFDPTAPLEWNALIDRWNIVLADVTPRTGIRPFTNHLPTAIGDALDDIPEADKLMSFAVYGGDLGTSIARSNDAAIDTLMCGVNAFDHFGFVPTPARIRTGFSSLVAAGCDQILVFGGARVYGSENVFGDSSIVNRDGTAAPWAAGVREGSGRSAYQAAGPARLLESRIGPGLGTVDGVGAAIGLRPAATVTEVQISGRAGIPATAAAAAVNVTVTNTGGNGFVTLFPCGTTQPVASQLNHGTGVTLSAAATVKLGDGGRLCIFNLAAVDLVVDVVGYFPEGSSYTALDPARLLETRPGQPTGTVDGLFNGLGARLAGTVTEVRVTGRAQIPAGAGSVVLNVTAVDARDAGFVTVYACDQPRPNASQLNHVAGGTIANSVVAAVSAAGTVCVFNSAPLDLVIDVSGYHPTGVSVVPVAPARLLESRDGEAGTVDGAGNGIGRRPIDSITEVDIGGRVGVPSGISSAVINLTVTEPVNAGFVSVYACDTPRPNVASINFAAGQTVANLVVSDVDNAGRICIYTMTPTHLIVDVTAYHP